MKAVKIKVNHWEEGESNMNTAEIIRVLVQTVPPQQLPTGLDAYKIMRDLYHSLETVDSPEIESLILTKQTYDWMKTHLFSRIPARWGMIADIAQSIDSIISAEDVDIK